MPSSHSRNRLACTGIRIGGIFIPPFQARSGEIVKLIIDSDVADKASLVAHELCRNDRDEIHADGDVLTLNRPTTPGRFREVFHRQSAGEWLVAETEMSRDDARTRLNDVQVNPDAPISTLAGTPRWLIGFLVIAHQQPAAIIFGTEGLDPKGIETALVTANKQLMDTAGIYITCFPDVGVAEPEYAAVIHVCAGELMPIH